MNETGERKRSAVEMLALLLAFIAATISFLLAISVYITQASSDVPLWPLPGLVLVDWVLAGAGDFISVFFSLRKASIGWLRANWIFTGSFIPLIILGAFSIGLMVMITFLILIVSTSILAMRRGTNWLGNFGWLMLGSIGNLGILMLIITLSGQTL